MKIALLADVHANLEALSACLAHAEAAGAEHWVFLGDLVGYGADPQAVLDIVMAYVDTGAVAILGNHDEAVFRDIRYEPSTAARSSAEWTRSRLAPVYREFLADLPMTVQEDDRLYVHASAADPEQWSYIGLPMQASRSMQSAGLPYVFSGHVHEPTLFFFGADGRPQAFAPAPGAVVPVSARRQWLAIVGSCGQARDGQPLATYAMMDTELEELTFQRLPYDHFTAARKVRQAGLPEELALRLETGA